jgi:Cu+-exporting ATPase
MHPEIVRAEPGSCPICGMALEPRQVDLDHDTSNPELADMTRRFWLAAAFTIPLPGRALGLSSRLQRRFASGPRGLSTSASPNR